MKKSRMKRTLGAASVAVAAVVLFAAGQPWVAVAQSGSQMQSLSAPLLHEDSPDPAIAEGLEVFAQNGRTMGRLSEVVNRGGEMYAVVTPLQWTTDEEQRETTIPYSALKVVDGIVIYAPE